MKNVSLVNDFRFFINQSFDDFDAFTETARGWDLHYDQLDRGIFKGELWQCIIPSAQIGRGRFNRKLEQQGAAPAGLRTFVISAQQELDLSWRRKNVNQNDLLVNPYNGDYYSISNACFDVFAISMTEELLEQAARATEAAAVLRLLESEDVVRLSPVASNHLRVACHLFFERLKKSPDHFTRGLMDEQLLVEFPNLIVQAIAESMGVQSGDPDARQRTRALKKAHDAIIEYANIPISVTRLCELSGMSERSLQYAFQEKFGISPKAYLQSYRLNRVRKMLRLGGPTSRIIADLANEWGFWHMGQFAKDYQRQFGELPRDTLRRIS